MKTKVTLLLECKNTCTLFILFHCCYLHCNCHCHNLVEKLLAVELLAVKSLVVADLVEEVYLLLVVQVEEVYLQLVVPVEEVYLLLEDPVPEEAKKNNETMQCYREKN